VGRTVWHRFRHKPASIQPVPYPHPRKGQITPGSPESAQRPAICCPALKLSASALIAETLVIAEEYNRLEDWKAVEKSLLDNNLFKDTLHEIEVEVLNRIQRNKASHERTTIKSLIDNFYARPYGWYQTAVLCIIAKLYKRNKISLKQDGNNFDRAVLDALQKNKQYANTIIELEEEIQNTQIQKLKNFYQEYFNEPNLGNEPKEISRLFKQRMEKEVKDLSEMYILRSRFKFLESLGEPLNRLKLVAEKEHPYFFNALDQYQDNLLDDKENVLEAVKKFMNGAQRSIFENVLLYLESNNANFDYIGNDSLEKLSTVAESPAPFKGTLMQEAKAALEVIHKEVAARQKLERETATEAIQQSINKLKSFADFAKLDSKQQAEIIAPF